MKNIVIPTQCPQCNSTLVRINDQIFCQNKACPAQLNKKVEHLAKTLGIKGLGEKTVEKLHLENVLELYVLELSELTEIVGEKTAIKLLDQIENSKKADFATVLAAMSIPLIGNSAAAKLATVVNNLDDITVEQCIEAGLGEKATNNLINWLNTEYPEIKEFLPFAFENKTKSESKVVDTVGVVCITGKLSTYKNKAEATKELESLGYQVVSTLTKAVTILVDEENRGSSKRLAAEERGLSIITNLKQFINQ